MDRSVGINHRHRPSRADASESVTFGVALLLAAALHVALLLPALSAWLLRPAEGDAAGRRVQMVAISRAAWEKNRRIEAAERERAPEERARPEQKKPPEEPDVMQGQVVRLPQPKDEERPLHADHLSAWDQAVERETRSRFQTHLYRNPTNRPQDGVDVEREQPDEARSEDEASVASQPVPVGGPQGPGRAASGESGEDSESGAGERLFALEVPKQAPRQGLRLKLDPDGLLQNRDAQVEIDGDGERARLAMGRAPDAARLDGDGGDAARGRGRRGGAGRDGLPTLHELTPSLGDLERIAGMPANDHLPEVETDAETRLNAWRWKHSTFFTRMMDSIRRTWHGDQVLARADPTGQIYGTQDRTTMVQVTIDKQGNVVEIAVAEPSGALALDDEAVRAFREAGPFANPPEALFRDGERFTFLFGFNIDVVTSHIDLNWKPY